ncbi:hypothetical protein BDP27DRAFT_1424232 [Rhodocollybia butyracea]|uniref:Uncharacterized protein n=1 Tax=Rhodocollybia butyracea TaxID=206335 RepID=A0A9P5U5T2_9AGAR|nr:hypothetical protein BDP27DRAFT_1424232 [Rhodocollybia butyracea]
MGQYWRLVNIDKVETFGSGHWGKLGACFWYASQGVLDRLSTAVNPYRWPKLMSKDKRSPAVQTSMLLIKLPPELLQAIAKSLMGDFASLMAFSFTCVTMWEVTEDVRFLYLRTELQYRSWEGNRIIFLGDYTRDLPQGLLTGEDREKLNEWAEIMKSRSHYEPPDDVSEDVSLLNRALHNMEDEFLTDYLVYTDIPEAYRWSNLRFTGFTLRCAPSTSPENRWMLRNLTKKEYVIRSTAGISSDSGLTQALFSLICWSDDSSISMECDDADRERMIRGPWAGDRIDLTVDSLHDHKNDSAWRDITKDVLVFLEKLAKSDDCKRFLEDVLPFW